MALKISEKLLHNSISAALSAIEVYNKPNFPYRNEVFSILIVNSWELLLKSKILSDNSEVLDSLHIYDNKGVKKTNRNNAPLTIEIFGAIDRLSISSNIKNNLSTLIEIRDTSIHFIFDQPLDYIVYSLGAACLRNYQKLIKSWFGKDLLEYNFYIMPLGFAHHFRSFKPLDVEKESDEAKRLISLIAENQKSSVQDDFVFDCEIQIKLVSAKKITEDTDLVVNVDPTSKEVIVVEKHQKTTDKYQLTTLQMWERIKKKLPDLKQHQFYTFLKDNKIKENEQFSGYNFRSKKHEDQFNSTGVVPSSTVSLFNENCYKFLETELEKLLSITNATIP